jgi:hypothetical protein
MSGQLGYPCSLEIQVTGCNLVEITMYSFGKYTWLLIVAAETLVESTWNEHPSVHLTTQNHIRIAAPVPPPNHDRISHQNQLSLKIWEPLLRPCLCFPTWAFVGLDFEDCRLGYGVDNAALEPLRTQKCGHSAAVMEGYDTEEIRHGADNYLTYSYTKWYQREEMPFTTRQHLNVTAHRSMDGWLNGWTQVHLLQEDLDDINQHNIIFKLDCIAVTIDLNLSACTWETFGEERIIGRAQIYEVSREEMIILLWKGLKGLFVAQSKPRFKNKMRLNFDKFVQIWQAAARTYVSWV